MVPLAVAALTSVATRCRAVLLGVLLTLLYPCIDASSCSVGWPAATANACWPPLLLMLISDGGPAGSAVGVRLAPNWPTSSDVGPFLDAFYDPRRGAPCCWLGHEGLAARRRSGQAITSAMTAAMVPAIAATWSWCRREPVPEDQRPGRPGVESRPPSMRRSLLVMALVGLVAAGCCGARHRLRAQTLIFTGATAARWSCCPSLWHARGLRHHTPAIVVTQTLVELLGMIVYVERSRS